MITVGIDEVGRGCWAGPLVAAAVIINEPVAGLKDSKKLSRHQRQQVAQLIEEQALAIGIGWVWPKILDSDGLTAAVKEAMSSALSAIHLEYDEVIVDGNLNYLENNRLARALIKADNTVAAVSAASIIAKVARDNYMFKVAEQYPEYGFESHVGYGTAAHLAALQAYGITPLHRLSFKPVQKFV